MEDRTVDTSKDNKLILAILQEEERLPEVSAILEKYAGRRRITMYTMASSGAEVRGMNPGVTIPVEKEVGGVTMFTLSMDALKKF